MSLQWTLTAFFLYVEVALVLILVLPILSPSSWKKIFNSRLAVWISTHGTLYFICFLLFLAVMFADAIREIRKYGVVVQETNIQAAPHAELNHRIKYFRAQRNLYITGFALFLWVVLKRLCVLISKEADLIEELEKPRDGKDGDELARTKNELEKSKTELKTMRKQAEAEKAEYSAVVAELEKVQKKVDTSEETKKEK